MKLSPLKSAWRWPTAWLVLCGLLALLVGVVAREVTQRQIEREAAQSALQYAAMITMAVPELPALLNDRRPSPAALEQLRRAHAAGEIFLFKIFDREGRLLLVSDELMRSDLGGDGSLLGDHHGPERSRTVTDIVLGGHTHVELKDGGGTVDRPPLYSEAYAPVRVDGQMLGVVEVYVDQTARAAMLRAGMTTVIGTVAAAMAGLAALAIGQTLVRGRQQQVVEARVRYLAHHDALSGARNRASFGEALAQAADRQRAGGPPFAVLCLDLDRFKDVNDVHGHAIGDEVLRQATARMRGLLRHRDVLARLGGDEFAVLQLGVATSADVRSLARRMVESLEAPYEVEGRRVAGGVSVGAAIFGADATTADELMHKADLALYRAKSHGRGGFSFYDAALDLQLQQQRDLTLELREAVATDALDLHYQPLFSSDGQTLTGYEALLRWPHPQRGMVPPSLFIPLAEESGLIEPLGRWVLRRACCEAVTWPGALTVAVNLSPVQFRGGMLVATVEDALRESGLQAHRLELEITESLLMSNTEPVLQTLTALRTLGARIAMDDFGTGYSSLAYLWRFPFDKLKIDQAFTRALGEDPKVSVIVRSIVSLAHSLQIRVNAEGVETVQQFNMLRQHGCDELQGFLFGRPIAAEQLLHENAALVAPAKGRPSDTALDALPTMPMPL